MYEHLDELLESGAKNSNTSDYVQDMKSLCQLLKEMGEYDSWMKMILAFEEYADEQNTVYFRLTLTEMWMEYYQTIGEMKKYIHLCVEHAELYQKQKEITDRERAAAIDIKIELQEKEAERKRAELKSTTDALTGLGNRYLLEQNVRQFVEESLRKKEKAAVGVLDIDCFKQHNDTYGHIQGDSCLKVVAGIIEEAVRGCGSAYRFGGDEFIILLDFGEKQRVKEIAQSIQDALHKKKIENSNSNVAPEVTVSQGYACFFPAEGEESDSLIAHADRALYYAKENGKNRYHIITE